MIYKQVILRSLNEWSGHLTLVNIVWCIIVASCRAFVNVLQWCFRCLIKNVISIEKLCLRVLLSGLKHYIWYLTLHLHKTLLRTLLANTQTVFGTLTCLFKTHVLVLLSTFSWSKLKSGGAWFCRSGTNYNEDTIIRPDQECRFCQNKIGLNLNAMVVQWLSNESIKLSKRRNN